MKKILSLLLALLFVLCTAHAQEPSLPAFDWHFNGTSHWQLDESGAPVSPGAHTPDDSSVCTGCGCEIMDWGDGAVDITDSDEYGNTLRYASFSGEEKTYESIHALTYDENGFLIREDMVDAYYDSWSGTTTYRDTTTIIYTNDAQGRHISAERTSDASNFNYKSYTITYNYEDLYFYNAD